MNRHEPTWFVSHACLFWTVRLMRAPRFWTRLMRHLLVMCVVVAFGAELAVAQDQQGMNPLPPGGIDMGSAAAIDMLSPGGFSGFDLLDSPYSLADLDPVTGTLLADDVTGTLTADWAIQHDLMTADIMVIDAAELARKAREAYERERKKAGIAVGKRSNPGTAQAHEVIPFRACGASSNTSFKSRPETVEAWDVMCRAAVADGLNPRIVSAWRDPAHQQRLYQDAIRKYGSAKAARKWVAFSDGKNCSSRHCSGIAIDVDRSGGMEAWMHTVVGCYSTTGGYSAGGSCTGGQVPVKRVQLYGFVFPMSHEPWHIELGVPVGDGPAGADCDPDRSMTVPAMIGAIWRCRLAEAGITGTEADRIVAEAVVVAKCESGWNTSAVAFGGKYVNQPHPSTGLRYTAAGIFQFIRSTANSWVEGGYANVHDPVKNIDAAARLWLNGYRAGGNSAAWRPWECAVGAASGGAFRKNGVLPQYGGGALPDWAYQY